MEVKFLNSGSSRMSFRGKILGGGPSRGSRGGGTNRRTAGKCRKYPQKFVRMNQTCILTSVFNNVLKGHLMIFALCEEK